MERGGGVRRSGKTSRMRSVSGKTEERNQVGEAKVGEDEERRRGFGREAGRRKNTEKWGAWQSREEDRHTWAAEWILLIRIILYPNPKPV
eukprot:749426-Hanusia_phi.AAC.1